MFDSGMAIRRPPHISPSKKDNEAGKGRSCDKLRNEARPLRNAAGNGSRYGGGKGQEEEKLDETYPLGAKAEPSTAPINTLASARKSIPYATA